VPVQDPWTGKVDTATGVDARWQALTGMTDASSASSRGGSFESRGGGFGGGGGGGGAAEISGGVGMVPGPGAGRSTFGDIADRTGGRVGMPAAASGGVPATGASTPGMTGPIGAPPMGGMGMGGAQAGGESHRRRVPFDADDPFDTGEKASKPVIGL
jgi:hypothetical protein